MDINEILSLKPHIIKSLIGMPAHVRQNISIVQAKKGEKLIDKGKPITHVFLVLSGSLTVGEKNHDQFVFGLVNTECDDVVGEMEVLAGIEESYFNVIAETDCALVKVKRADFLDWTMADPFFSQWIAKVNAIRHCNAAYIFDEYKMMDIEYKLELVLYRNLAARVEEDQSAVFDMTRQELSEKLLISLRTVNRIIKVLKDKGAFDVVKGKITLYPQHIEYIRKELQKTNLPKQLVIPYPKENTLF